MGNDLRHPELLPVTFKDGDILSKETLNRLQDELIAWILTHNHAGATQGAQLGPDAIADGAIQSRHLSNIALVRGQLAPGAVGPLEIGDHVVQARHLDGQMIEERHVKDGQISLAKLAQEVLAEIKKPRGATTFAYCAYLSGDRIWGEPDWSALPAGKKKDIAADGVPIRKVGWASWLLNPSLPYPAHGLKHMWRDDAGEWRPLNELLNTTLDTVPPKEPDPMPPQPQAPAPPAAGPGGPATPPQQPVEPRRDVVQIPPNPGPFNKPRPEMYGKPNPPVMAGIPDPGPQPQPPEKPDIKLPGWPGFKRDQFEELWDRIPGNHPLKAEYNRKLQEYRVALQRWEEIRRQAEAVKAENQRRQNEYNAALQKWEQDNARVTAEQRAWDDERRRWEDATRQYQEAVARDQEAQRRYDAAKQAYDAAVRKYAEDLKRYQQEDQRYRDYQDELRRYNDAKAAHERAMEQWNQQKAHWEKLRAEYEASLKDFRGRIRPADGTPDFDLSPDRIALTIDPAKIGWEIAATGEFMLRPGVTGNAFFNDGKPMHFIIGAPMGAAEEATFRKLMYHYGLATDTALLGDANPRLFQFLNHPHLLPTGYWVGTSRNVKHVIRSPEGAGAVRVTFATPYADTTYTVDVTTDATPKQGPVSCAVWRRGRDYVDLLFHQDGKWVDQVNFSLAIHGELAES